MKIQALILLFVVITLCLSVTNSMPLQVVNIEKWKSRQDTTLFPFEDNSYRLRLHMFDSSNVEEGRPNVLLIFEQIIKGSRRLIFEDSLYSMFPKISVDDYNNDRIKDILVFFYTGASANPAYHLYLRDMKHHSLIRVIGFEELTNPMLDEKNNIIISLALSGTHHYSFYRINAKNKLINLGHDFEADPGDSLKYENAIQQIRKKYKN